MINEMAGIDLKIVNVGGRITKNLDYGLTYFIYNNGNLEHDAGISIEGIRMHEFSPTEYMIVDVPYKGQIGQIDRLPLGVLYIYVSYDDEMIGQHFKKIFRYVWDGQKGSMNLYW